MGRWVEYCRVVVAIKMIEGRAANEEESGFTGSFGYEARFADGDF
jgi:hypothetical protein